MTTTTTTTTPVLLLALFGGYAGLIACSDDNPSNPSSSTNATPPDGGDGGGEASTAADASASDTSTTPIEAGPKLITYSGSVHGLDATKDLANQPPLPDVNVCVASVVPESCVKTNALGRFVLRLPANDRSLRLTYSIAGYAPVYHVTFTTEEDDTNDRTILVPDAIAQTFWSKCGASYPNTNGAVVLRGYRRTGASTYSVLDGATMTASSGVGPCYMAAPFIYDPQPTATTTAGLGAAVIANAPQGASSIDVTITLANAVCYSNEHLIDGASANIVRVPIRPGFMTAADVICE